MELILKIGAQVMFVNNDIKKQWINGTVGKVMDLDEDKIVVRLYETNTNVDVHRIKWTDYYYRWNSSERTIERKSVGEYCQFPLVLAWSMTIHKSQGRTIEKVHLDLEREIFETGQAYVALSRCRSVKGLSMTRMLNPSDILVDEESKDYYQNLRSLIEKLPPEEMMKNIESMDSIPNA